MQNYEKEFEKSNKPTNLKIMTDEEIDIAAMEYAEEYDTSFEYCAARDAFIAGAKWAEEQMKTQSL